MDGVGIAAVVGAAFGVLTSNVIAEGVKAYARRGQATELIRDDDVRSLRHEIESLRDQSELFWRTSASELGNDRNVMISRIVASLHKISLVYSSLLAGSDKQTCDVAYMAAHNAITGENFDDPNRQPDTRRLSQIYIMLYELERHITRGRRRLSRNWLA